MSKLQNLTQFLKANLPERVWKTEFSSEMDEIQFIPAQKEVGLDQYQMLIQKFEAVIAWGRFPYRELDPRYIPLLINAWLAEQDNALGESNIEQEPPSMTIDVDEETAVVVVTLSLAEPIVMKKDTAGIIPFEGKKWSIVDPQIGFAEHADIYRDVKNDNSWSTE